MMLVLSLTTMANFLLSRRRRAVSSTPASPTAPARASATTFVIAGCRTRVSEGRTRGVRPLVRGSEQENLSRNLSRKSEPKILVENLSGRKSKPKISENLSRKSKLFC